jgi:hypothetical protein
MTTSVTAYCTPVYIARKRITPRFDIETIETNNIVRHSYIDGRTDEVQERKIEEAEDHNEEFKELSTKI